MTIEELAIWMNCNTMTIDSLLCVINTTLIFPGLVSFLFIFLLYLLVIGLLIYKTVKNLLNRDKG